MSSAAAAASASAAASAAHTAFLLSHISSSAPHPAHTHTVQACTRFAWTAGGAVGTVGLPVSMWAPQPPQSSSAAAAALSSSGVPLLRAPGIKIVFHWPVPATSSVAAELRKWEAILSGGDNALDPVALIGDSAAAAAGSSVGGIKGATAASQSLAASALPSLPAPALSTGARWAVVVENCFLLPRAGVLPAASAASAGPAAGPRDHEMFRVRASFGGSLGPPSSWLLTRNLILEGSAAMDRWLDGLAPAMVCARSTAAGGAQAAAALSSSSAASSAAATGSDGTASGAPSLLQVRSQVSFSGEEWNLGGVGAGGAGDFVVRLGTLKEASRQRALIVMEIECPACVSAAPDNLQPLYELARRMGVPATDEQLQGPQVAARKVLADFGMSTAQYTLAHGALQYYFLVTSLRDSPA